MQAGANPVNDGIQGASLMKCILAVHMAHSSHSEKDLETKDIFFLSAFPFDQNGFNAEVCLLFQVKKGKQQSKNTIQISWPYLDEQVKAFQVKVFQEYICNFETQTHLFIMENKIL